MFVRACPALWMWARVGHKCAKSDSEQKMAAALV
jgi:hypothetical protein